MVRILHLSDTHVSAAGPDEDGVDAVGSLERMLHDARHVPDLDVVVVSGDVADDGSVAGCAAVRDRVGAFAAAHGIPHVYCTGNHDDRGAFATALGSGHLGPGGTDRGTLLDPDGEVRAAVSDVAGTRVITLDSLVPGQTHGSLDEGQLDRLDDLLSTPAAGGSVLVLHHPPLTVPAIPLVSRVVLQNADRLADVVRGSDVRAVLCGHLHFAVSGALAGVPVSVAPGVVTRIDTTAPPHLARGVLGAGSCVVDLAASGPPVVHQLVARDPRAGEQVYLYDAATGEDVRETNGRDGVTG